MTGWTVAWSAPDTRLFVERRQWADGLVRHRFRSNGPGDGAVVVARDNQGRILFINHPRPVVDRLLLELPRGQAEASDADPLETAARELREETGLEIASIELLGVVYPDSGISGDAVNVVVAVAAPPITDDAPEFTALEWLAGSEIAESIRAGTIRDAISLAALSLDAASPGQ